MTAGLATIAAVFIGTASYVGGVAGRIDRRPGAVVAIAWLASVVGLAVAVVGVILFPPAQLTATDIAWSVAGGATLAAARPLLYHGLSRGPVVVFAPVSAIVSLIVPVIVEAAIGPGLIATQVGGLLIAIPAVLLLASKGEFPQISELTSHGVIGVAVVSGTLFGLAGVCFSLTNTAAGLAVVVVSQTTAVMLIPTFQLAGQPFPLPRGHVARLAAAVGAIEIIGVIASIIAFQRGPVSAVAAIIGLAPATTMVYAWLLDDEPIHRSQIVGAAFGAAAVILFAIG